LDTIKVDFDRRDFRLVMKHVATYSNAAAVLRSSDQHGEDGPRSSVNGTRQKPHIGPPIE
jgi:hypothetical protein